MSLSKNPKLIAIAKQLCRDLRKRATYEENMLWIRLRNRKLNNVKYYRQYPIFFDMYGTETFIIADFLTYEKKLVIEIDGGYHERQKEYDNLRTYIINCMGYKVIRFKNEVIKQDIELVLKSISDSLI
jgi:very-short-patch-repair endonuclease